MMKVHFVMTSGRFSGGRQELLRHADALKERGHDVTIWIDGGPSKLTWFHPKTPVIDLPPRFSDLPKADVILFDRFRLSPLLVQAKRGIVVHFCQSFEGSDVDNRRRTLDEAGFIKRLAEGWQLKRRKAEIDECYRLPTHKVVSHRHLGELIQHRYTQKSDFVPYGLPPGVFEFEADRPDRQTILVVGPTATEWKRVPDALEAVKILKSRSSGIRLIRVAQNEMCDLERSMGVTDEYHTMLPADKMAELYHKAAVLLITSDSTEGFGLPLLEAMACGTPAVATEIPAFKTFGFPADYARFAPVGDTVALADEVQRLLTDESEWQRLQQRGRKVASEYTAWRSYETMEKVLKSIVSRGVNPLIG